MRRKNHFWLESLGLCRIPWKERIITGSLQAAGTRQASQVQFLLSSLLLPRPGSLDWDYPSSTCTLTPTLPQLYTGSCDLWPWELHDLSIPPSSPGNLIMMVWSLESKETPCTLTLPLTCSVSFLGQCSLRPTYTRPRCFLMGYTDSSKKKGEVLLLFCWLAPDCLYNSQWVTVVLWAQERNPTNQWKFIEYLPLWCKCWYRTTLAPVVLFLVFI